MPKKEPSARELEESLDEFSKAVVKIARDYPLIRESFEFVLAPKEGVRSGCHSPCPPGKRCVFDVNSQTWYCF